MSDQETRSEVPWRGDIWRHVESGDDYQVIGRATFKGNREIGEPDGDVDAVVVYRRLEEGAFSLRNLDDFLGRFAFVRSARRPAVAQQAAGRAS